jgi:hypothetical protein
VRALRLIPLLTACRLPPYAEKPGAAAADSAAGPAAPAAVADSAAPADTGAPAADPMAGVLLYHCIQIELSDWGRQLDRCRVELGFIREDDPFHQAPPDPIEPLSEVPYGDCALETLPAASPAPAQDGPSTGLDAGPALTLRQGDRVVELRRYPGRNGGWLYAMEGCDLSTFPFGAVMDLEVPGTGLDPVPAFTSPGAVWFSGRTAPAAPALAEGELPECPIGEDLHHAWVLDDPARAPMGVSAQVEVARADGLRERLRCPLEPADAEVTFPADGLLALTSPEADPTVAPQLSHRRSVDSPPTPLPWGGEAAPRSLWSLRGALTLPEGSPAEGPAAP